jgi:hypothetical protein
MPEQGITDQITVLGRSGKIRVANAEGGVVEIAPDSLRELDAAGAPIADTGALVARHTLPSFATTDFDVAPSGLRTFGGGLQAEGVTLTATTPAGVTVTMDVLEVVTAGEVANGDETLAFEAGALKVSVALGPFPFCAAADAAPPCLGATGAALEFAFEIKTLGGAAQKLDAKRIRIGSRADGRDVALVMSERVQLDGSWTNLTGDVALEARGAKHVVRVRFPRYAASAYYDPSVEGMQDAAAPAAPPLALGPPPSPAALPPLASPPPPASPSPSAPPPPSSSPSASPSPSPAASPSPTTPPPPSPTASPSAAPPPSPAASPPSPASPSPAASPPSPASPSAAPTVAAAVGAGLAVALCAACALYASRRADAPRGTLVGVADVRPLQAPRAPPPRAREVEMAARERRV